MFNLEEHMKQLLKEHEEQGGLLPIVEEFRPQYSQIIPENTMIDYLNNFSNNVYFKISGDNEDIKAIFQDIFYYINDLANNTSSLSIDIYNNPYNIISNELLENNNIGISGSIDNIENDLASKIKNNIEDSLDDMLQELFIKNEE